MKAKPRVAVLLGGSSSERNISIKTGSAVVEGLRLAGFKVARIDAVDDFLAGIKDFNSDVAFIALHGEFGEDGEIQSILEENEIPYTGSGVWSCRTAMDKVKAKELFIEAGLPTPGYRALRAPVTERDAEEIAATMAMPVVVKPVADGSSIGLSLVEKKSLMLAALESAGEHVLVEECVTGRELTVAVMDGKPFPIVEIIFKGKMFDYEAKYEGGTVYREDPDLPRDVKRDVVRAAVGSYNCLKCRGVARVDIILSENGTPYILEVNTVPGMTATSLVPKAARRAGMGFQQLVSTIVESGLAANRKAKEAHLDETRKASA